MARTMQRSIHQNARDWPLRARTAFAAGILALLGMVASNGPGLAQAEVVSTETATTLHMSTERSAPGTAVTLTANVDALHAAAALGAVPAGFVDFYDETTARPLGRADVAHPSITVSNLTPGVHEIRAHYRGTTDFMPAILQPSTSPSVMLHVLFTPELQLSVAYSGGGAVDLAAVVAGGGPSAPRGAVTFRDGESLLAAAVQLDSSGRARFMTSALTTGSHVFVAEYSGDAVYAPATATIPKLVYDTTNPALRPFSKAASD